MGCFSSSSAKALTKSEVPDSGIRGGSFIDAKRGKILSAYQILSKLGSGGFATVKLCKHLATDQLRAVKFVNKGGLNKTQLDLDYFLN